MSFDRRSSPRGVTRGDKFVARGEMFGTLSASCSANFVGVALVAVIERERERERKREKGRERKKERKRKRERERERERGREEERGEREREGRGSDWTKGKNHCTGRG